MAEIITAAQNSAILLQAKVINDKVWPTFMSNDPIANQVWHFMCTTYARYQFILKDDEGAVIGAGHATAFYWDANPASLPSGGWDYVMIQAERDHLAGRPPNTLSAIAAMVDPEHRSKGVSRDILQTMKTLAKAGGLAHMVAPVRPTLKPMYPLIPMTDYITWTRDDGTLFDPWLRTHARLGAWVVGVAHESMRIEGSVAQWAQWTDMHFPQDGPYVVPGALVPVVFEGGRGVYVEPNVWMLHSLE